MGQRKGWLWLGLGVLVVAGLVATRGEASSVEAPAASGGKVPAGPELSNLESAASDVSADGAARSMGGRLSDRTGDGAVRAVLVFLEVSEELIVMSPGDAGATQRAYSVAARGDEASAEIAAQVAELQSGAAEGMHLDVAPISWTVQEVVAGAEYVVDVWYVEVFSLGGAGEAFGSFKTYSARVLWEEGGWKLVDGTALDGPHPVVGAAATSGPELRRQLTGFSDGGAVAPLVLDLGGARP